MSYQKWPRKGQLAKIMNKTLPKLKEIVRNEQGGTHTEVMTTIVKKLRDDNTTLYQGGCTPNFKGGLLTYTACRHDIQARNTKEGWTGQWFAGFTSKQRHGDYYLVFLMKVIKAFDSFKDIWDYLDHSTRSAKNARNHHLGDLYEPKSKELDDKWYPENYYPPIKSHPHFKNDCWHKDINYFHKAWKRRACQLVGDPDNSFLWNEPLIRRCHPFSSPRSGKKYDDFKEFLEDLCPS